MDLRQLRYFVAVAEEGHITRAADRLGMQQPPLSQQIKAIERELGVQLLHRRPRGVSMTDAGRVLFDNARAILARVDHAMETTRRTARGEQGRICIGLAPTAPFHAFVPRVIRGFREAFPLVSLSLEESLSNQAIDGLRREQIDVAFLRAPVADPQGLAVYPLLEEPMVVALPSAHALAQRAAGTMRGVSMKALAGETFIVYGRPGGPGIFDATMAACLQAGFSPMLGQEAPRITTTLGLVAAGLGIALVPGSMQRLLLDGVAYRGLRGAVQPKVVLNLAARRADPSVVVRNFLSMVRSRARRIQGDEAIPG